MPSTRGHIGPDPSSKRSRRRGVYADVITAPTSLAEDVSEAREFARQSRAALTPSPTVSDAERIRAAERAANAAWLRRVVRLPQPIPIALGCGRLVGYDPLVRCELPAWIAEAVKP